MTPTGTRLGHQLCVYVSDDHRASEISCFLVCVEGRSGPLLLLLLPLLP